MATNILNNIKLGGFTQGLGNFITITTIILAISAAIWLVYWILQYKHTAIIRKLTSSNRVLIHRDKIRIIKKKGEAQTWKLLKLRKTMPTPPDKALDIDTKGKYHVEAYYTENEEFQYLQDNPTDKERIGSLHPLKASDKQFYLQELEDSKKWDKKKLADILMAALPGMMIVIIFVLIIVFWDKLLAPADHMASAMQAAAESLKQAAQAQSTQIIPPN